MKIEKEQNGTKLVYRVEGSLDIYTAPELEKEFGGITEEITEVVVDAEKLEYISSAGLRALLVCAQKMDEQGAMSVTNCQQEVREVFRITGFDEIMNVI